MNGPVTTTNVSAQVQLLHKATGELTFENECRAHVLAEEGAFTWYYLHRKLLFTSEIIIYLSHVLAKEGAWMLVYV